MANVPWARSIRDVEGAASSIAHVVHTEVVEVLPRVAHPTIDAGPWQAEPFGRGMRFALVYAQEERVVGDFLWDEKMVLRVLPDFVGDEHHVWFDVLIQLVLSELAPTYTGLAFHAASVTVSGKAVLLCGRSGAGKTTIGARLIRAGARPLSHDRTMVFGDGAWRAVSTPFGHDGMVAGDERECELGAMLFIEQALENTSEKLGGARAASRVASVMLGARSSIAVMNEAMLVTERLVREVPCHVVRLTNDDRAAAHVLELVG